MAKRESEPIERFHVMLFSSDVEWFKDHYGSDGRTAFAIRHIVRGARRRMEEKFAQRQQPNPKIEDEEILNELDKAFKEGSSPSGTDEIT